MSDHSATITTNLEALTEIGECLHVIEMILLIALLVGSLHSFVTLGLHYCNSKKSSDCNNDSLSQFV